MNRKFEEDGFVWYVDEEKGTCVCKCPEAANMLRKEYRDMGDTEYFWDINFAEREHRWFESYGNQMSRLFGKAKANVEAGEVIDIERGKEIARARLIEKLSAYRASFYSAILDETVNFVSVLHKRIEGNKRITLNSAAKASALAKGEEWNVCD